MRGRTVLIASAVASLALSPSADAALRVVTYNLDADTDRNNDGSITAADGVPSAVLGSVLSAIGNYQLGGRSRPIDVLAVQELYYAPATTLQNVVDQLNAVYGAGTYKFDPLVGGFNGNLVGNGPSGLVYNTKTVKVLSAANVGVASGAGSPRTPVRYQLQAVNEPGVNTFYLYNSHAKAGGTASDLTRRGIEATNLRANYDTLPRTYSAAFPNGVGPAAIYAGDFNTTAASADPMYTGLTTTAAGSLSANGQAFDPVSAGSFSNSSSAAANERLYTFSNIDLSSRLDYQLATAIAGPGETITSGMQLLAGTYTSFGNSYYANGVLTSGVNYSSPVATAANATATGIPLSVLQNLSTVTDHLPVVADYAFVPEPGVLAVIGVGVFIGLRRRA